MIRWDGETLLRVGTVAGWSLSSTTQDCGLIDLVVWALLQATAQDTFLGINTSRRHVSDVKRRIEEVDQVNYFMLVWIL